MICHNVLNSQPKYFIPLLFVLTVKNKLYKLNIN